MVKYFGYDGEAVTIIGGTVFLLVIMAFVLMPQSFVQQSSTFPMGNYQLRVGDSIDIEDEVVGKLSVNAEDWQGMYFKVKALNDYGTYVQVLAETNVGEVTTSQRSYVVYYDCNEVGCIGEEDSNQYLIINNGEIKMYFAVNSLVTDSNLNIIGIQGELRIPQSALVEEDECSKDSDCDSDEECNSGECEELEDECSKDSDCDSDEECNSGECEELDCNVNQIISNHECVNTVVPVDNDCGSDDDCEGDEYCSSGEECEEIVCDYGIGVNHECIMDGNTCLQDSYCGSNQYCGDSGDCLNLECGTEEVIEDHACVPNGQGNGGMPIPLDRGIILLLIVVSALIGIVLFMVSRDKGSKKSKTKRG